MTRSVRLPLLAKVLGWLVLHLIILGLSFFLFVRWQLGMGLDSLLSGAAGERLGAFGDTVVSRLVGLPQRQWNEELRAMADEKAVTAALFDASGKVVFPTPVPPNVLERAHASLPPQRAESGPPGGGRPGGGRPDAGRPP